MESPIDYYFSESEAWENDYPKNSLWANCVADGLGDEKNLSESIVLFGVNEDRGALINKGTAFAPDVIREEFFSLFPEFFKGNIIDLGNISAGATIGDTYHAIKDVVKHLAGKAKLVIMLGGSSDLAFPFYQGLSVLKRGVSIVDIDAKLDIVAGSDASINASNFKQHIFIDQPSYLFNYSNIGCQTYLEDPTLISLMQNLSFDLHRIGKVRGENLPTMEPVLRNADYLIVDMLAVKASDNTAHKKPLPNGFYSEEICQLMKYAGVSDQLQFFSLHELNPQEDNKSASAQLVAQMLWCLIEGVAQRVGDYPYSTPKEYEKYSVPLGEIDEPLVFYKSNLSGRWWLQAPKRFSPISANAFKKLLPCSNQDFDLAKNGVIPDSWWTHFYK